MRHSSGAHGAGALVLCALLLACGQEGPEAGIAVVEGAPLAVAEEPTVVIGERAGSTDHELYLVRTPFLTSDGRVGVPLAADGVIRMFDRDGNLTETYGGQGEGPGEFRGLAAAWARGDTVEAFDSALGRITRFLPDGTPETIELDDIPSAQAFGGALEDGGWVLYGVASAGAGRRDGVAVHRFSRDGRHVGVLHELEGMRRHRIASGATGPDPISPKAIVRTHDSTVYVAQTLEPRIVAHDIEAGTTDTISWSPTGIVSGAEAARAAGDELSTRDPSDPRTAMGQAQLEALTGNEVVPVFADFLVDTEGFVWLRDYEPARHAAVLGGLAGPGPGGTWSVISPEKTLATVTRMPSELEPVAITRDEIVGVRRDELGVESVRVHALERGGRP